jgi:tetratricopeptide (TPR) repeat protein
MTETKVPLYLRGSNKITSSSLTQLISYPDADQLIKLMKAGRLIEAEIVSREKISKHPAEAFFWKARGVILSGLGFENEAIEAFKNALVWKSDDHEVFYNMGISYYSLRQLDRAKASFERAIDIHPFYSDSYNNLGNVLREIGMFDGARNSYDAAIKTSRKFRKKDHTTYSLARLNRAMLYLLQGKFRDGFIDYEYRKSGSHYLGRRHQKMALWAGNESLSNKTILVIPEQGLGDIIQFCRYIPILEKSGARILFDPYPSLSALIKTLHASFEIVDADNRGLKYDYCCPLLSLPFALGTTEDNIPSEIPYLFADPWRTKKWRSKLGASGFKIGICWQGKKNLADIGRSFPLTCFTHLAEVADVRLINLHKGVGETQLESLPEGMIIESMGEDFDSGQDSFLDTAAVMTCCDLIITSDTAIAHLAGALGMPVWVALKKIPDWRWMLDRSDSPWYPTMRLFRQKIDGDWYGVFADIKSELVQQIKTR